MRMAASSARRTERPCKMLAFGFLLLVSLLNAGVVAQEIIPQTASHLEAEARGDMIPKPTKAPEPDHLQEQSWIFPTVEVPNTTEQTTEATATQQAIDDKVQTNTPSIRQLKTTTPMSSRGDGPNNKPEKEKEDVICVSKEAVQDKNAVSLKLKTSSNCKDTKVKIESVLHELCGEDCKLEIYQEDGSDETLVCGKLVDDDVIGMTNKFNKDNIKDKTNIKEAALRWRKNSKLVLVTLLLTGLLLAALLVAGYYLKTHRKNSKGVRLAESFQVDEENQANTLVSVAPLPQEPIDKPTVNGESPPENGTNAAPATNGHSQTQSPVVDTQM